MHRSQIVIVTPAFADANNGNWQTAHRWAGMLSSAHRVRLAADWSSGEEDLMIALHARRSAVSADAWHTRRPGRPLVVVLTGTDLYRDIDQDAGARRSLDNANALVVLNELGVGQLPDPLQNKAQVVLQSCRSQRTLTKTRRHLRAVMVGHLRPEKAPRTFFAAARQLQGRADILFDHVGAALDATLGDEALALATSHPRYRWLGGLPHGSARRRIQTAHVLVHPSSIEGGAHVVIEAVRSGTPVLASRIDGNVGLLGDGYAGYFPLGDASGLAAALSRLRDEPRALAHLQAQCTARAPLFDPARESHALHHLVESLLNPERRAGGSG